MNKFHRVLILLGIFLGFGISCASAASVISFNPQTVEVRPGSSQNVQMAMDEVPNGLSGFNITISVLDPEVAEITAVSFPGWGMLPKNSTVPSSSVWIKTADLDNKVRSGDTNVLLGIITLTGKKAGTVELNVPTTRISDDNGSLINPVISGKEHVSDNGSNALTAADLSTNATSSSNDNTNATGAVIQSKSDAQNLEQNSSAANAKRTTESTQSPTAPVAGSKKTPGFELIYGLAGLLAVFHRRK